MAKLSTYEKYYKDLAEVWHHHYDDQTYVLEAIMILQGCIVEMHSDVIQFELKNGAKKVEKAKERLQVLQDNIQKIASVQSDNYSLKHHNKLLITRNKYLEDKVNEIKKQELNAAKI